MPKELPLYQEYADFVKRCLLMCGLYPYQQSVASKYLPIFWILGYCLDFCALINFFRLHITEISAITACLSVLSGIVNMTIRASRFVICKEKLVQVTDTLEALFEETSMQQPSSSPAFHFMLSFYRLGYYHYVCMVSTAFLYSTKPLIGVTIRHANRSTPFPAVYPLPIDSTAFFVAQYLLEVSICYSFCIITSGVDAFFTLCAFRMSSVFRAMAVELEEFPKRRDNGESNEQVLRRCIDRHVTLIKCRDTIQEIYGPIIFSVMMTNCLGMCALIFDVSKASAAIAVEKAVAITLYLTGKILQTFMYTWPGDVVTSECDIFRQEVYCNNWYEDLNTKTGKLTLTILMQKSVILRACKLMAVTVDLFAKIMNRTISYYFLLVTLDDAE
ncbi:odorant receptor 4-like isoform X2 [Lasioglossum baleicum]|uniref:odorant receptor 4-like isoform X2 n=1 Tax=Lasioglossum baleicum TaxID=434251 RepID=UPI003FCEBED7